MLQKSLIPEHGHDAQLEHRLNQHDDIMAQNLRLDLIDLGHRSLGADHPSEFGLDHREGSFDVGPLVIEVQELGAVVQRARLWAITCTASQAPLAAKRPEGSWFRPTPYLRSRMAFLDLGVAAVVGLQFQGLSVPVGDEAVIAVGGEEGQLRTGRGLHPPDDEPHRCGAGLSPEGGIELVSEVSAPLSAAKWCDDRSNNT